MQPQEWAQDRCEKTKLIILMVLQRERIMQRKCQGVGSTSKAGSRESKDSWVKVLIGGQVGFTSKGRKRISLVSLNVSRS